MKRLFIGLILFTVSCSKTVTDTKQMAEPVTSYNAIISSPSFGVLLSGLTVAQTENQMRATGTNLVRVPLYFSQTTHLGTIDKYLKDGFNVQINFDYNTTFFGPYKTPTDTAFIRQQATEFCKYYQPYLKQIPVVVVENEWDNQAYHAGTVQQYLTELATATQVMHQYGFKVADGGITCMGLQSWYYSTLNGQAAKDWIHEFGVSTAYFDPVDEFIAGIKNIAIDYLNVHIYTVDSYYPGLGVAATAYKTACGKARLITNEMGIIHKTGLFINTSGIWDSMTAEIFPLVKVAVAYSGKNTLGGAVTLSTNLLTL